MQPKNIKSSSDLINNTKPAFTKLPYALLVLSVSVLLTACQTAVVNPNSPSQAKFPTQPNKPQDSQAQTNPLPDSTQMGSQPLPDEPINEQAPLQDPPKPISSAQIIQQQNAKRSSTSKQVNDGSSIPAFNKLMKMGISQLRAGNLGAAENTFTNAQRMGPQSPAVYLYLSEIAIKRGQGTKAENLARRGLLVSRSTRYDKALWKMIEISGQIRGRGDIIAEARKKLAALE